MEYWLGYYEKASKTYQTRRDKAVFELDKGSANFTYAGYLCGVPGGAWCAMQVSTAIREACGDSTADAKAVMHGVWPYTVVTQVYDAAPAAYKGRRGAWTPKPGDIVVFADNGVDRTHTGLVYAVDGSYIYTMEGNSSNMCKKRSYLKTSTYVWGYVRPLYADAADGGTTPAPTPTPTPAPAVEQYGAVCCKDPELHTLSKGVAGPEVKTLQRILYARGIKGADGRAIDVDGDFGTQTKAATITLQKQLFPNAPGEWDGIVGAKTWTAMLTKLT